MADLSAEQQPAMKKFLVEYELPYVHLVRVGIQAKNEESAISIADQAFTDWGQHARNALAVRRV